jgi:type IV pilus assembly protein PilW
MKIERRYNLNTGGFTLAEVLVSLAIISILIAALAGVFERSGKLYTTQNATAALQQEVRAALDVIATEMRMAAYDPRKTDDFVIKKAAATEFRFLSDLDGDGKLGQSATNSPYNSDKECEARSIRFSIGAKSIQFRCGDGTPYAKDTETLIGDTSNLKVTSLDFNYRDKHDNSTSLNKEIRSVIISIRAQAPAGRAGMIERTYSTVVDIRNTGPNA